MPEAHSHDVQSKAIASAGQVELEYDPQLHNLRWAARWCGSMPLVLTDILRCSEFFSLSEHYKNDAAIA